MISKPDIRHANPFRLNEKDLAQTPNPMRFPYFRRPALTATPDIASAKVRDLYAQCNPSVIGEVRGTKRSISGMS